MRLISIGESIRDNVINKSKVNVTTDKQISLQKKALDLLVFLYINQKKAFTRDDIIKKLWDGTIVGGRVIDIYIMDIRKKIGKDCIKSIPGVGYKFNSEYQLELSSNYPQEAKIDGYEAKKSILGTIYVRKDLVVEAMDPGYRKWRKANVSYRGTKADSPLDGVNEYDGVMGKGLYTTPLSNKSMAKGYGTMYIMVGAIPKKPLMMRSINDWEIWSQKMMAKANGDPSGPANQNKFFKNHTIEDEVQKLGYDGVIITGREMVLYDPDNHDIRFFKTESEVEDWYEDHK